MTGFAFGMLAALLWIAVVLGVGYLMRSSPGHPFRTIRNFRVAGTRLAKNTSATAPADEQQVAQPLDDQEPKEPGPFDHVQAADLDWAVPEPPPELSREVLALVGLAPTEELEAAKGTVRENPPSMKKGPRRLGRIEYVIVDEDGRPEI